MEQIQALASNAKFLAGVYDMSIVMSAFFGFVMLDLVLKGWGMWRAARMQQKGWFLALLFVNSLGILPAIYLLATRDKYQHFLQSKHRQHAHSK